MKILSWIESKARSFDEMPVRKKMMVFVVLVLVAGSVGIYLGSNPVVLSIRYDDDACYSSEGVYTFYEDAHGMYYLSDGADPFDVTVTYLFAGSEDLNSALQEGNITIEDLDRFDIEYGIIPSDR